MSNIIHNPESGGLTEWGWNELNRKMKFTRPDDLA